MTPDEVQLLINRAIRDHEARVAVISGVMGVVLLIGAWSAIWMCR